MLGTITQIDHDQLRLLLERPWTRRITSVHVHHTWRPNHAQWRGKSTVEAIRRYHVEQLGWSDIAEHLTIGPDGSLWTGRSLDRPPASATGHNGTATEGPFMIEVIGDFDVGQDVFTDPQATSAYRSIAEICAAFQLNTSAIRFHNEFTHAKSCPGTSFDLTAFREHVAETIDTLGRPRAFSPIARAYAGQVDVSADHRALDPNDAEVGCNAATNHWQEPEGARGFGNQCTPDEIDVFRSHVVDLTAGQLSQDGCYSNTEADLDELVRRIDRWAAGHNKGPVRIVLFGHGGLVDEHAGLGIALRDYRFWLLNDVYPVFFVWETGFLEVFAQYAKREAAPETRAFITDPLLEATLGPTIGRPTWDRIKNNAFLSSSPATGSLQPGGAYLFAAKLAKWHAARASGAPAIEFHAVAHSAGSIFHCHFLPALEDALAKGANAPNPAIQTLALLAPAVRVDLFAKMLAPRVGKSIGACAMFTMQMRSERVDNVIDIYRKSLLYFVRNACERPTYSTPILGLEESVRSDPALVAFFGLDAGGKKVADVVWSPTTTTTGNAASQAIHHGDFDNDSATMNSALRRILGLSDGQSLTYPHLPVKDVRACTSGLPDMGDRSMSAESTSPSPAAVAAKKRALCIGIDSYGPMSLNGCVADAQAWTSALQAWQFEVKTLINERATRQAMAGEIDALLGRSSPGDIVVIQYAGHGTQLPDLNNDESDGFDEAWVPCDYEGGEFLIDDDIGMLFDRYRSRGVQLVVFADCCHSGTSTRFFPGPGSPQLAVHSRYMDVPPEIVDRFKSKRGVPARNARALADRVGWEIHFAACQDKQSAYERNGHGDFTRAATKALADALRAPPTYSAFGDTISAAFSGNAQQTPSLRVLSESAGLVLFGSPARGAEAGAAATANVDARDIALETRLDDLTTAIMTLTKKISDL